MDAQGQTSVATSPACDGGRILEAVRFLKQCHTERAPLAAITGPDPAEVADALAQFAAEAAAAAPGLPVIRIPAPTDSAQAFLESIIFQLGLEPDELATDDLQRLLTLVLRQHAAAADCPPLLLLEDAEQFGPRVFEVIRELIRNMLRAGAPVLVVLGGSSDLIGVLDSPGMASVASLTRRRFALAGKPERELTHSAAVFQADPCLALATLQAMLGGQVVAQHQLGDRPVLIGRSPLSDLRLDSRFVSRQHALVIPRSEGYHIVDLNSTNGTLVNSRPVQQWRLTDADTISIGHHRIRFLQPGSRGQSLPACADTQGAETLLMRSLHHRQADGSTRRLLHPRSVA